MTFYLMVGVMARLVGDHTYQPFNVLPHFCKYATVFLLGGTLDDSDHAIGNTWAAILELQ
jgi:hypothetical protein